MPARIALASTRELPHIDADEALLLPQLAEAEVACWDDPSVDWAAYDLVILRSTWNYHDHLDAFRAWTERVAAVTTLFNPPGIVRWNTDKRYLRELAAKGNPVVPSTFVEIGHTAPAGSLAGAVVVKPTVSAGSKGAKCFLDDAAGAAAHVAALHAAGKTAMIQPYIARIDELGERALVYLGGVYSHAATKAAILSGETASSTGLYADEHIVAAQPTPAERLVAERIVADLPTLAYTRVDLLPGPDGPLLLELEVTEPSLFLWVDDGAPARAAAAFRALLP